MRAKPPNGLELSCPAEAGRLPFILAHTGGPSRLPYATARRVSFSELLGGRRISLPRRAASLGDEFCGDLYSTGNYLAARFGAPSLHLLQ